MLRLVIGNKSLSSWSLRPWILLKHLDLDFDEVVLDLDTPGFATEIRPYSPAGRVPVLLDGELRIWESLAICEFADELTGGAAWPTDPALRAEARAVSAEMHAGFVALRAEWPFDPVARDLQVPLGDAGRADVRRVEHIWNDCMTRPGRNGPWLFGQYSIADAMFAPVVLRFLSYGASLSKASKSYFDFSIEDPHLQEWVAGARAEAAASNEPQSA